MMTQKVNFITTLLLLFTYHISAQNEFQIDSTFLKKNIIKINSITDADNNDLSFLDSELEGVEILMLGEQSHGDGSTFLAKTKLIKYLHNHKDFNVLVFESGLADAYRVWKMIKEGSNDVDVFDYGIFQIWAKSQQTKELFEYVLEQSKSSNPLIIAGFDMQPTGALMPAEKRWSELKEYLKQAINFDEEEYPVFSSAFKNIRMVFSKDFTKENKDLLLDEFHEIIKIISKNDTSKDGKFMSHYIDNYLKTIILYTSADLRKPSNTPHVFNLRDKTMAENLKFLKEEIYTNEKFIVWGANSHLGYGRGFLQNFQDVEAQAKGMIPMGQYLKIDYQDKLYTLAFTSYDGAIGSLRGKVTPLEAPHSLTLESMIAKQGYNNAFLSMRNEDLKTHRFATRIYGHMEMSGIWAQMCDGIFFIKTMIPNTIIKD